MTTPGWSNTILQDIIQDPPGTWRAPDQAGSVSGGISLWTDVASSPHRPVTVVVAVTPVNVGANDNVKAESWILPVTGGSVSWDAKRYPQGQAEIEVSGDLGLWRPGPKPLPPHVVDPHPDTPSGSSEQVPWAVLPFGTIISIYRGWEYQGRTSGFRVFDGFVTESRFARGDRKWSVTAVDFSGLLDRVSWRYNLTVAELIQNAGGPPPDAADEYSLAQAIQAVLREAGEFWWPMPNTQLEWAETSVYDVPSLATSSSARVSWDQTVGGQSGWSLIEEWTDSGSHEIYMRPGRRGQVAWELPADVQSTGAVTDVVRKPGGTLMGFDSAFQPRVNRVYYSLHAAQPDYDSDRGAEGSDYATIQVDPDGLRVVVRCTEKTNKLQGAIYIHWGDGSPVSAISPTGDQEEEHTYDLPGWYTIRARSNASPVDDPSFGNLWSSWTVAVNPGNEFAVHGFANRFNVAHPLGVRRSGRVSYIGERQVSAKRLRGLSAPSADSVDDIAEKMFQRVKGYSRRNTLQTVPMPWLMPRTTISVDLGDGLKTERHLVDSVTLPLNPVEPMTVETVNGSIGGPAAGSPRVDLVKGTQTDTNPGADVTATATVKNGSFLQIAWGDGTGKTTIDNTAGTTPWTVPLTHTYTTDGTFKVTAWTDDGVFDRIQFEVPTP